PNGTRRPLRGRGDAGCLANQRVCIYTIRLSLSYFVHQSDIVALSEVRIHVGLGPAPRMGDRAKPRRADTLRIPPDRAGVVIALARLPVLAALGQFRVGKVHADGAVHSIDVDHVAIADQADRPA